MAYLHSTASEDGKAQMFEEFSDMESSSGVEELRSEGKATGSMTKIFVVVIVIVLVLLAVGLAVGLGVGLGVGCSGGSSTSSSSSTSSTSSHSTTSSTSSTSTHSTTAAPPTIAWSSQKLPAEKDVKMYFFAIGDHGCFDEFPDKADNWTATQMKAFYGKLEDKSKLAFTLGTGDNFYEDGLNLKGQTKVAADRDDGDGASMAAWVDHYGEALTNTKTRPWFTVLGNHDYGTQESAKCGCQAGVSQCSDPNWKWQWEDCNQPKFHQKEGHASFYSPPDHSNYFETQFVDEYGVEVIGLNLPLMFKDKTDCGQNNLCYQKQVNDAVALLEARFEKTTAKHVFVFSHYPFFTLGQQQTQDGVAAEVMTLFAKKNRRSDFTLTYFSGHSHQVKRTNCLLPGGNGEKDLSFATWITGAGCKDNLGFVIGAITHDNKLEMVRVGGPNGKSTDTDPGFDGLASANGEHMNFPEDLQAYSQTLGCKPLGTDCSGGASAPFGCDPHK